MLLLLVMLARFAAVSSITTCQTGGPEYWCESCENAKECSPEIEDLLNFCQTEMILLLDCEISVSFRGYAEGVMTDRMNQINSYYYSTVPSNNYQMDRVDAQDSRDYYGPGFDGFYGPDQFYGNPGDSVRYYNFNEDEASYIPELPEFEQDMLREIEYNTALQWGYTGEAKVTSHPIVEITEKKGIVNPTQPSVTQTFHNPLVSPPAITRPLYNISAYAGQATVLSCVAESDTEMGVSIVKLERAPKKSWLDKDKRSRKRGDSFSTDKRSITAFLTIDHLDEVDSGWYVCMAINEGGRDRSLMYLDITDLCKGIECEGHLACIPDYHTQLTSCACPQCENHLELVCGSNCKTYQNDCWLEKDNCELGTNHSMMIHAPCPRVVPPIFAVEPSDVEVEEGHHLILECHALSFPVPTYDWYKLDKKTDMPVHVGFGPQYKVDEAIYEDGGYYFCEAAICEKGKKIKSRVAHVTLNEHNLSTKTKTIVPERVCRVFGDPHIMTFDGNNFKFPGVCSYILAMDCELAQWSVYGRFENCSGEGMQGSCLQSITVVYETSAIELQRGWSINYLGEKIDFFETQQNEVPYFHFDLDENLNLHVEMENGAAIIWDGLYSVQIKLPTDYRTKSCGICGDGNGDKTNDFISSKSYFLNDESAKKLGIYDFCESWKIDPHGACPDWASLADPRTRCSEQDMRDSKAKCAAMFDHPAIMPCQTANIDREYYIDSCAEDMCTMKQWSDEFDPACGVLSAYTSACRVLEVYIDDSLWREDVGCPNLKDYQKFVISKGCPKSTLVMRNLF